MPSPRSSRSGGADREAAWHRLLLAGSSADDVAGPPGRLAVWDTPARHRLQRGRDRADEDLRRSGVIAIQNARMFNETQESLARQTATSDVLQVISESPTTCSRCSRSLPSARRRDGCPLLPGHAARRRSVAPGQPARGDAAGTSALRAAWPRTDDEHRDFCARDTRARVVNVADLLALSDEEYAPEMKQAANWPASAVASPCR